MKKDVHDEIVDMAEDLEAILDTESVTESQYADLHSAWVLLKKAVDYDEEEDEAEETDE